MYTQRSRILLAMITGLFMSVTCVAQEQQQKPVAIVARSYADHIVLRYFATSPSLFNAANKLGYIIERSMFAEATPFTKLNYKPLKGSPFTRWNEKQWESGLKNAGVLDSTETKLAGLAMAFTDNNSVAMKGDVMENDLKSLKEQKDNADMKFGFTLIAANRSKLGAEGLALRISDNDVATGKIYVYRIRINQPSFEEKDWVYLKVQCGSFNKNYLLNNKAVVLDEGDKTVAFTFPESDEYFAFNVERSDDEGSSYKRITTVPSLKLKPAGYVGKTDYGFTDSGLINYKKYRYRLLVSTLFADELVLSEFVAIPRDKTPPVAPFLKSVEHVKPKEVELRWELIEPIDRDLKGFVISRSSDENGVYKNVSRELLPVSARSFIDKDFTADGPNYYVVAAVDTAGNISRSFPNYVTLIDSTPPAPPNIASAVIDSLGKVIIKIHPNSEKDFMGYQVLKANAADHEFSVIEETYSDSLGSKKFILYDSTTLNTLTPKIYYKLIAFDTHFNQSKPSKIIELKRRDTIPPVSPLITGFTINDSSVVLNFVNSESEDVVRNVLLRRTVGKVKYDSVFSNSDTSVTRFIDKKIRPGDQYEYAMIARDESGLASKVSNSIILKTLMNNRIPAPILQGVYDKPNKRVSLVINNNAKPENKKLKAEIYKKTDQNAPWVHLTTISLEKGKTFTDDKTGSQRAVMYTVRLIDENNKASNFSNEVEIIL